MAFPIAAALGLASTVAGMFGKNKKAKQTLQMAPEVKQNYLAYMNDIQNRMRNTPNYGMQGAQQGMGVFGNAMGWSPGAPTPQGGGGQSPFGVTPGQPGFVPPQQAAPQMDLSYANRRRLG